MEKFTFLAPLEELEVPVTSGFYSKTKTKTKTQQQQPNKSVEWSSDCPLETLYTLSIGR